MSREFPVVEVHWDDSCSDDSWQAIEQIREDHDRRGVLKCRTMGFLVYEDDAAYIIASTLCAEDIEDVRTLGACQMCIPKSCVTGFWELTGV